MLYFICPVWKWLLYYQHINPITACKKWLHGVSRFRSFLLSLLTVAILWCNPQFNINSGSIRPAATCLYVWQLFMVSYFILTNNHWFWTFYTNHSEWVKSLKRVDIFITVVHDSEMANTAWCDQYFIPVHNTVCITISNCPFSQNNFSEH